MLFTERARTNPWGARRAGSGIQLERGTSPVNAAVTARAMIHGLQARATRPTRWKPVARARPDANKKPRRRYLRGFDVFSKTQKLLRRSAGVSNRLWPHPGRRGF